MSFDLQLVHRRKPRDITYLRLAPFTRENPTLNQMLHRIRVGEAAQDVKGLKGLDPNTGLPRAASTVKSILTGSSTGQKRKVTKWLQLFNKELDEEIDASIIALGLEELLSID